MVAGDHDRLDARGVALLHRCAHLRPGRVDHADESHEGESLLQSGAVQLPGQHGQILVGHPQHPQGLPRHGLVPALQPPGGGGIQPAPAGEHVGGPFDAHPPAAAGPLVDGSHELALRVKGQLPPPGPLPLQSIFIQALPGRRVHQCGLGGIAGGHRLPPLPGQGGIGAQGSDGEGQGPLAAPGRPHVHHGHAVLGERACLVRADHPGAPQGLHGGQALDDGPPPGHAGHPQGQHNGDDGGQPLGDGGHRQGDGGEKHVQHGPPLEQPHPEHHRAHAQADEGQGLGDLRHLLLEGGLSLSLPQQQPGNAAHLGVHAGAGDHAHRPPPGDDGGREHHIVPLRQGGVLRQGGQQPLGHGDGLAGHGALIGLEGGGLQNPGVGGHQVPRLQMDDVAGHQPVGLQPLKRPVPHHLGQGGRHLPQGLQGLLGAVLLGDGDAGVHHHDDQDDGRIQPVLAAAGPQGQGRRGQQHQDHGVLHLPQEAQQQPLPPPLLQPVGPPAGQPPLRLRPAQPPGLVRFQLRQGLSGAVCMPYAHVARSSLTVVSNFWLQYSRVPVRFQGKRGATTPKSAGPAGGERARCWAVRPEGRP